MAKAASNIVYPIYKHVGYFEREYIFYASRTNLALDFITAWNRANRHRSNGAYYAISRPLPEGAKENTYRGWHISWEYGYWTAYHDDYDASWEGEEDGWVDNGLKASARELADLITELDEHERSSPLTFGREAARA